MKISPSLLKLAVKAKEASKRLRLATTEQKNRALHLIADALESGRQKIIEANQKDLAAANLSEAMLERLSLETRLDGIIADVRNVASLPDPVGETLFSTILPNGLKLSKKRVPIGVIGVIYESRPNVTVDIASLCLKTSNCAILRGGKETLTTNIALMKAIQSALKKAKLPEEAIQLISSSNRALVKQLVRLDGWVDMIIPRGGHALQQFCLKEGTIPVITGGIGICHLFVDESADMMKACEVVFNAKTQRPSVCNSLDTVLVHHKVANEFLSKLIARLSEKKVRYKLDPKAWELVHPKNQDLFQRAEEQDWSTEWLSLTLGVKVVDSLGEAIEHVQNHSTNHSDGILTNNPSHAAAFVNAIDSCAVYVNASTRFTDGAEFGLGAEVAVSTQKLHARGPLGLEELTSYKWVVEGDYHVRK